MYSTVSIVCFYVHQVQASLNTQNYNEFGRTTIWLCGFENSKTCKTGIEDHCSVFFCPVTIVHCVFLRCWFALSAWGAPLSQR